METTNCFVLEQKIIDPYHMLSKYKTKDKVIVANSFCNGSKSISDLIVEIAAEKMKTHNHE